jgi:mannose-6-phosphate isomerase-like protein (cupin superfamily)
MRYALAGLSVASTAEAIETHDQLGGSGCVRNKALAIPSHLNGQEEGPWASVEYVSIDPIREGEVSSVGQHTQSTDECYCILKGEGTLTTNGVPAAVSAGWVALAPRGTTHTIRNDSPTVALEFLVVELYAPGDVIVSPALINLAAQMTAGDIMAPVRVAGEVIRPRRAVLNVQEYLGGRWGSLAWIALPPGARVDEYYVEQADQLLLLGGFVSVGVVKRTPTEPGEHREEIVVDSMGEGYHCVIVPPGVPRHVTNRASGPYPAFLLCFNVVRRVEVKGKEMVR